MSDKVIGRVLLNNVRLAGFVALHEPKDYDNDGNFKYSAKFLLDNDSEQATAATNAMKEAAVAEFKDKAASVYNALRASDKLAVHDGDSKPDWAGFEGKMYISGSARPSEPPRLLDRDKSPLTEDSGKPYQGCYVDVIIDFWAQNNKFGRRINATIRAVRFREDGERLGNAAAPVDADMFEALPGVETANDVFDEDNPF